MRALEHILLLYKKELLCLFRDKDILLYGVLLPLLLVPTLTILMFEGGLWCMGMCEHHKYLLSIDCDGATTKFIQRYLKDERMFEVVPDANPAERMKDGTLDGYVKMEGNTLSLYLDSAGDPLNILQTSLKAALSSACRDSVNRAVKKGNLPAQTADVFSVKNSYLNAEHSLQNAPWTPLQSIKLVAAGLFVFLFVETAMTAAPALAIPLVNEIEQKTMLTAMLMPVSRFAFAASKFLAGYTVTLVSAIEFFLSIFIAALFMGAIAFVQVRSMAASAHLSSSSSVSAPAATELPTSSQWNSISAQMLPSGTISNMDVVLLVISDVSLFCLATATSCALLFAIGSWSRSTKEAQMLVSIPGTAVAALPLVAMMPGCELNMATAFIPILNLFLVMKQTRWSSDIAVAVLENLILIVIFLTLGGHLTYSRNNLSGSVPFWRTWRSDVTGS